MASVLHGSARTTPRIRAELQASKESARALAARYGLNAKTVRKWRKRTTTADAPMGPKTPKSTVLTPAEEAIVVAFRQKTLLPLDDVLGCLKDANPQSQPQRPAPLPAAPWRLPASRRGDTAYNFAKHLKALKWRTPYQVICEAWTKDPSIFKVNPRHLIPGPYSFEPTNIGGRNGQRFSSAHRPDSHDAPALGIPRAIQMSGSIH